MKFITKKDKRLKKKTSIAPNAKPDSDADKSGTDKDSDKTQLPDPKKDEEKFDKPKRETDPDRTDIDIQKARGETVKTSPKVPIKTNTKHKQ